MLQTYIDDSTLAQVGAQRVKWFRERMKVLSVFKERYEKERPFEGKSLLVCMHCEPKAAVRTEVLLAGGAKRIVFIGNLGSTKPDTAAYLSTLPGVTVMAKKGDTLAELEGYVEEALTESFDLLMDNGASLMQGLWQRNASWKPIGAIEETRSGKLILERKTIAPNFPVLVIDDSPVKRLVENEAGVGQSVVDGYMRATSTLVGGKKILIIGYGYCGAGVSQRFRALGATTFVYDIDPLRMLKAKIEGHMVGRLEDMLPQADVVVTVTGRFDVVREEQLRLMKDGTILCNAGHYNMEIDVPCMDRIASEKEQVQDGIDKYIIDGKRIYLLQNANPVNLSSGAGNPIEIMELGYALQLLSLEQILSNPVLPAGVQDLPKEVNDAACWLCLENT